jgi:hypothetical protein
MQCLFSSNDVVKKGLFHAGVSHEKQQDFSAKGREDLFRAHFGSPSGDVAEIWYDLITGAVPEANIGGTKDQSEDGFKKFMLAHFYLWTNTKNSWILSTRFNIAEHNCRGKPLWKWIGRIAALKARKIVWGPDLASPTGATFFGTIDCIDCKVPEPQHPTMNVDTKYCSVKMKHAALKYELVIAVQEPKVLSISGPFKGGTHDMTVFRAQTKQKMLEMPDKMLIADGIYKPGQKAEHQNERNMFSIPSSTDPPELKTFKSRARCRHESFNGRIKNFNILSECFKNALDKHVIAFTAVCVIMQYQMDNGSPIFSM